MRVNALIKQEHRGHHFGVSDVMNYGKRLLLNSWNKLVRHSIHRIEAESRQESCQGGQGSD